MKDLCFTADKATRDCLVEIISSNPAISVPVCLDHIIKGTSVQFPCLDML